MSQITLQVLKESFKEGKITIDWGHKCANKYKRNQNLIDAMNKVQNVMSMSNGGQKGGGTTLLLTN